MEHDLFGKPVSTFPDHALTDRLPLHAHRRCFFAFALRFDADAPTRLLSERTGWNRAHVMRRTRMMFAARHRYPRGHRRHDHRRNEQRQDECAAPQYELSVHVQPRFPGVIELELRQFYPARAQWATGIMA
jgi:hypothetical protein